MKSMAIPYISKPQGLQIFEMWGIAKKSGNRSGVIARSGFCDEAISPPGDCFAKTARNDRFS